ncbi:anthranilate phosphoribosyltransferase family protein [Limnofasciculus baicalensis]|uniref:Anthranilate phosphoribosyltransferase family protein n=1 Tax=Limnofasciculus baicalensis BBK-W-15 TaxID=2699891 RepID=A0AAE3KMV3_9CYAN|nr:anthranilate phosphoribosyltransferase family protein [Limnofasciculus baicalensis]MCP2729629.1 anthranilate phosphoribosyltransferase family protein [Limnofasciculus baicalensis BBK-W-15]
MSNAFRELLKKVGSGTHTGKDLSREEAEIATRMMLLGEATPAQIGAFLIAHRIKRPTSEELAGMLDAYDRIGPKLVGNGEWGVGSGEWKRDKLAAEIPSSSSPSKETKPVTVLGTPYDGRDRTAPVTTLTALILAAAGVSVLMHGGDRIPTKYGIPLMEIWQELGVDLSKLSLAKVQELLEKTGLGFIYLPQHFPEAQELVTYRDQIGKRPPIATMELIWSPYAGEIHQVAGYVHPPTEVRFRDVFKMRGVTNFTLVKGLEGSCDLPCDRTAIIAISNPNTGEGFERLLLHPSDYGFAGKEVPFESTSQLITQMEEILAGKSSNLLQAAIWNGGFYLWRCGVCEDLQTGLDKAENLFTDGYAEKKLTEIKSAID